MRGKGYNMRRLYRSVSNRYIAGVFGGLGEYFHIDATILRLIFVILLISSFFTFGLFYVAAALIIPEDAGSY